MKRLLIVLLIILDINSGHHSALAFGGDSQDGQCFGEEQKHTAEYNPKEPIRLNQDIVVGRGGERQMKSMNRRILNGIAKGNKKRIC